ncbi:cellulose synthase/poly-beta-1,6-N-acetylglucosamine synthase-like glycosyltransferase [Micromonospora pisi]|uniref:Cellulose synthase/poly-beta-1,6-N-acetylglucosamine synthase-like glycosyltransferase n=1 Tax=Micromonospora pisi TaxID=589240 RepID=A0A495JVK6_9ACTN|nr:glycosyltransferase family 2 protein [Micromonospora pisi]RKR92980.1 cellulose synthase/poly-beta-1,6-N-acetylglucosamine synthase-like glycosyltransferase [Micromonospora pisi]
MPRHRPQRQAVAPRPSPAATVPRRQGESLRLPGFRWWMPGLVVLVAAVGLLLHSATPDTDRIKVGSAGWWTLTTVLHLPMLVILIFLVGGLIERFGYFWRGRVPTMPGRLPSLLPTVCVQLPMFNEHAVARRAIEAACALMWPAGRLTVQILDDSTDEDTRALVERTCADLRAATGVDCYVLHRVDRQGYKAGALEAGRRRTDAEFLVIFDADFIPSRDYLLRVIPHFYLPDGTPDDGLALVQAQWGHLNHDESALTRAQSLWVDDHHTLQMSWRSAMWRFVNFTGTAGVWRASAIEAAGGWRAASLVEDCELSFRHLFANYRTAFVKDVVVPAELPATYTAYKAQQRRWTQGWVQLQRLHLATLAFRFECTWPRRIHLLYHMSISWQWPAWAIWISLLPFLIVNGLWFGAFGAAAGLGLYMLPCALWTIAATTIASLETRHVHPERPTLTTFLRRVGRVVPYLVINTGMLPHQFSAFCEGLFGPLHSEFERTPKTATITAPSGAGGSAGSAVAPEARAAGRRYNVRVHWPYVLTEAFFVAYQLAWSVLFATQGLLLCALGAVIVAGCVLALAYFYGDHAGKVCFVVDKAAVRSLLGAATHRPPSGQR